MSGGAGRTPVPGAGGGRAGGRPGATVWQAGPGQPGRRASPAPGRCLPAGGLSREPAGPPPRAGSAPLGCGQAGCRLRSWLSPGLGPGLSLPGGSPPSHQSWPLIPSVPGALLRGHKPPAASGVTAEFQGLGAGCSLPHREASGWLKEGAGKSVTQEPGPLQRRCDSAGCRGVH